MACFSWSLRSRSRASTSASRASPILSGACTGRARVAVVLRRDGMSSTGNVVTVSARGAARLRGGHPWVYAEDVARQDARGDVVRVVDGRGATLGTALWAPGARLPLRLFARDEVTLDAALVEKRVRAADELRRR